MKNQLRFRYAIIYTLLVFLNFSTYAQEMSREKAYIYMIKLMNWSPENCVSTYGFNFDKLNYHNIKSDEFARKRYNADIEKRIKSQIDKINFNDKFTITGTANFGEYNFEKEMFPILSWNWNEGWVINTDGGLGWFFQFYIKNAVNLEDFQTTLKMKNNIASGFIKTRKNMKGEIDRTVFLKATYSILDKQYPPSANRIQYYFYLYSIDIYSDQGLINKISTLFPYREYYDKVKGIKMKEGTEIFYYKDREQGFWSSLAASIYKSGVLPTIKGAKYFRQVKYFEGKILEVKDYYNYEISGKLEMTGSYDPYCFEPQCANGLFTWYWENGFKRQEANFVNGKIDGCVHQWDKDGKCRDQYSLFMEKRDNLYYTPNDKRCPCVDITSPIETNVKILNSSNDGIIIDTSNATSKKLISNGIINFNYSPFLFKGTWHGSNNGVMIQLINANITTNAIDLIFTMQAMDKGNEVLIYHPTYKKADDGWTRYKDVVPPYIQDDNGQIFYSTSCVGGSQKKFNSDSNGIYINASEKITVTISFPMVSEGASKINFVCPGDSGHQSDWYWNNINLIK